MKFGVRRKGDYCNTVISSFIIECAIENDVSQSKLACLLSTLSSCFVFIQRRKNLLDTVDESVKSNSIYHRNKPECVHSFQTNLLQFYRFVHLWLNNEDGIWNLPSLQVSSINVWINMKIVFESFKWKYGPIQIEHIRYFMWVIWISKGLRDIVLWRVSQYSICVHSTSSTKTFPSSQFFIHISTSSFALCNHTDNPNLSALT